MSVALQSWEVGSGPTMGYKMAIQSNMCAMSDVLASDVPNYISSTHISPELYMKAVPGGSDVSKGPPVPNHEVLSSQDTVIHCLSSLSIYPQPHLEANNSEDRKGMPACKSSESSRHALVAGNESTDFSLAACPAGYQLVHGRVLGSQSSTTSDPKTVPHYAICGMHCHEDAAGVVSSGSAYLHNSCTSVAGSSISARNSGMSKSFPPPLEEHGGGGLYCFPNTYCSPKQTLDVVAEDKPWEEDYSVTMCDDLELDTSSLSSTNSCSSLHDSPADSSTSSGEGLHSLHGVGEAEVQSEYKGPSSFSVDSFPPRRGLSQFYAGKSRSFSCLGDVVSLKDLSKPENPYAKKRKCSVGRSPNVSRPLLPPLQKGSASISKKSLYNGKSRLALGVAMSTRVDVLEGEDKDNLRFVGMQRWQSSPLTSRSYSLSDLQGVSGSRISPS